MRLTLPTFLLLLLFGCKPGPEETSPVRQDIIQAVYASGKVVPVNSYTVFGRLPGYVTAIHVKAGDTVKTGDLLLEIRNEQNEWSISSLEEQVRLARENADPSGAYLSSLTEEVTAQSSRWKMDSMSLVRTQNLYDNNACSRQRLDQAVSQAEISRSAWMKANENYNQAKLRTAVEYQNLTHQLSSLESNRDDYRLLAAVGGRIYDVFPKIGTLVGNQTPLIEIGDANRFEAELSIDETDIGLLRPCQTVLMTIDAYPDTVFHGSISEVPPFVKPSIKSARVKTTLETLTGFPFYSGMSVEANIIIQKKKNCLVIPREFVRNGNEVMIKGENVPRKIRKGIEDLQFIEILSGLNEDEVVVK